MWNLRLAGLNGLPAVAVMAAAVMFGSGALHRASAQTDKPLFKVVAPAESVKKGDKAVPIEIDIDNASNIASFSFDLKFNASIFEPVQQATGEFAQKGDFLGSSGREVVCNSGADTGVVKFRCVTLRLTPAGPSGSGKIATVFLKAIGSGTTDLKLDRVVSNQVVDPPLEVALSTQDATIVVKGGSGGINWLLWGGVAGGIAVVVLLAGGFAAMRARGGAGKPATAT